jgi:hypothetical protein
MEVDMPQALQGPEIGAVAVAKMSWETLSDEQLLAAYMGATFHDRPRLEPQNIAWALARDLNLVSEDGSMHDLTFKGLELAVERAL